MIADAGLALSAVGPTTVHVTRAEELLRGKAALGGAVRAGGRDRLRGLLPGADGRGPVDYKRHLAGVLTQRALRRAAPARSSRGGLIMQVTITINGERCLPRRRAAPAARPLHPRRPGLTGTHWGCDTSNCGACVVLMDGKPVKSCTTLAAMCEGHEIRTVESLEVDGELDPVQQGFHESTRCSAASARRGC